MPVKGISIPWHTRASLPSTYPAPAWPSSLPVSESYSKGSVLGQAGSPGRSNFKAPSAPSPPKHWSGHPSRLPSWERAKQTCLGRGGRERVCAFSSWKREICADLGSEVGGLLGHVEPMRGGSFPMGWTGTKHSTICKQRPNSRTSRAHPTPLTCPAGL